MEQNKLGLVLEGGASRTYYSCGIMDGLLEEEIYADLVIGTSAGIANGVSYVSRQKGRNYQIGTQFLPDKRYQGARHLLNRKNRSFYNLDFIFDEIPNKLLPFDYTAFASYPGEVLAAVTNIETGKAEYLPVSRQDRRSMILRASCALPILFCPIEINGTKYMDGGICDSIPAVHAFERGCGKAIIILTQPRDYRKHMDKTLKLSAKVFKKYPLFAKALLQRPNVYNQTLDRIFEYERQGKAFVFAPEEPLGMKRTESSPEEIKRIYRQGYADFRKRLPDLKAFLKK